MDELDYTELWERYASEERREYDKRPIRDLLDDIKNKRFGDYYAIWNSIAARASLEEAGLVFLDVLESGAPDLVRYNCARALITLAQLDAVGWKPEQLSGRGVYATYDNMLKVRQIVEEKLKAGEQQAKEDH